MAGRQLGKGYVVLEKLGSGAFGVVWKARGVNTGRLYAIKEIDLTFLSEKEQEECVKEVEMLALLDCPYIIKYYDSFVEQASLFIVTEYAPGGPLARYLTTMKSANTPLPEATLWRLLLQLLAGVHHMHTKRVLHRDLKPLNIFLDDRLHVKIGDLGVSRMLSASTRFAHTLVGTPYYLSPEMCEGAPYDERSDVWALGVVMYEAATFRLPFEGRTQAALALKILKGAYKPITGYSADLTAIIDRCLCTRRAARPDTDKLLVLPSVQAWAGKLHLELPLVAVPRRIMGNGGVGVGGGGGWGQHGRSASWSPVAPDKSPAPPTAHCHTTVRQDKKPAPPAPPMHAHPAAPSTPPPAVCGSGMQLQASMPRSASREKLSSQKHGKAYEKPTTHDTPTLSVWPPSNTPTSTGTAAATPTKHTKRTPAPTRSTGGTGSPLIRVAPAPVAGGPGTLHDAIAQQHARCVMLLGKEGLDGLLQGLAVGEDHVGPLAADSPAFRALHASPEKQKQAVEAVAQLVRLQQQLAGAHI